MNEKKQMLELLATIQRDVQAIHFLLHTLTKTDPNQCRCVEQSTRPYYPVLPLIVKIQKVIRMQEEIIEQMTRRTKLPSKEEFNKIDEAVSQLTQNSKMM